MSFQLCRSIRQTNDAMGLHTDGHSFTSRKALNLESLTTAIAGQLSLGLLLSSLCHCKFTEDKGFRRLLEDVVSWR